MIVYDLKCGNGHAFEGWFEDGKAFEKQLAESLVECPVCDDASISRVPSTFAIKTSHGGSAPPVHPLEHEILAKKIYDFVDSNFDDVGCDFAKEALKIHYGVSEARNIKGVSTKEEEKTLKEEGINFLKIPVLSQSDTDTDTDADA